jgi:hypothetical protein
VGAKAVPVRFRQVGGARSSRSLAPDLTRIPLEPLVSCLCVTENRHAFIPWVLWNFDRQTWRKRELVIVDSSDPPIEVPRRKDVRVIRVPLGTWLGKKRNLALEAARGQVIAWFDDDDWQHPRRLASLIPALREYAGKFGASFIGPSRSFFVDLYSNRCQPYKVEAYAIFNGSVFYTEMVRHARFPENVLRSEDTAWIATLLRTRREGAALDPDHQSLFLWLSHDANISNQRFVRRCATDFNLMLRTTGDGWLDTPRQLEALRARLRAHPAQFPARAQWIENRAKQVRKGAAGEADARPSGTESPAAPAAPGVGGPELALYLLPGGQSRRRAPDERSAPSGPVPADFIRYDAAGARYGRADAIAVIVNQRRHEWKGRDYVGFFDHEFVSSTGLARQDFAQEIGRINRPYDVYYYAPPAKSSLGQLFTGPEGASLEPLFRHVLTKRLGKPRTIFSGGKVPIIETNLLLKPDVLARYVREWLVPARARLRDPTDAELRALVGGVPSGAAARALLASLFSLFLGGERCSLRLLDAARV